MVLFSKGKCLVMDEFGKKLISGLCTLDNYYGLVPDADIVCNSICLPNEDLWHQRMGYASYKHLSIVSKHESVLGIPKLSRMSNVVCGPCQFGKQTKAKHPDTQNQLHLGHWSFYIWILWVQLEPSLLVVRDTSWLW